MKTGLRQGYSLGTAATPVLAVALFSALISTLAMRDAHAVRIEGMEGLKGLTPVASVLAVGTPAVRAGRLELRLADQGTLSVTPWPQYLPQRFDQQRIGVNRQLHPAGPIDRISLTRGAEPKPWLEIVHGARSGTNVLGDWLLQRTPSGWTLAGAGTEHWLGNGAQAGTPAVIPVDGDRWCVYLLESRVPQRHPNVAYEEEPQADWAAVRLEPGRKRCAGR